MTRKSVGAVALCALLLSTALAGCMATPPDDGPAGATPAGPTRSAVATPTPGSPPPAQPTPVAGTRAMPTPSTPASATPSSVAITPGQGSSGTGSGHALAPTSLLGKSASLSGVSVALDARAVALQLAQNLTGLGDHRAVLVFDASVAGSGSGVLVALPDKAPVRLEGRLAGNATTVTLDATQARLRVGTLDDIMLKPRTSGALDEAMRAAGYSTDAFFAELLDLRAEGPLTVRADRVVLVTAEGVRELGGSVTLSSAGRMTSTAAAEDVRGAAPVALTLAAKRGHLAAQDARGDVRLSDKRVIPLQGDAVLTLAKGASVKLASTGSGVQVALEGRAFQVYAGGAAHLRSTLRLELDQTSFTLVANETAGVAFRLVASDPDADPVISSIRVEGGPARSLVLPGYVPVTQQILDSMEGDPFGTFVIAPALPIFAIGDALLGFLDALFGPARITQSIEAGTTFRSVLTVVGEDAPYDATLVIEGNFDTQRVKVHVA